MDRVIHFEIQAENPERAIAFYTAIFNWKIEKWKGESSDPSDYWVVLTAPPESREPGINGGLLRRPTAVPPQGCGTNAFVCTVNVSDFDATAEKILAAGGTVAMPKWALTGMAWVGYFLDTEGNTFGIHQADPNAK